MLQLASGLAGHWLPYTSGLLKGSLRDLNVSEAAGTTGRPSASTPQSHRSGFAPCPELKIVAERHDYICQERGN